MKQILCFGDSNTFGLIPGTGNRYDWNIRWTGILDKNLREKGYRIIEEGLCGRTTVFDDSFREGRKGADILPTLLESHNPIDIVILMLGTNDCKTIYNATAETIGKGIQRLLQQIKQKSPQAKIILVSPIYLGQGVGEKGFDSEFDDSSVETSENLHKVYNRIADENEIYYLKASGYANPSPQDREHLDENGHRKLAEGLLDLLEGVITDGY